jgi:hypothetical protein
VNLVLVSAACTERNHLGERLSIFALTSPEDGVDHDVDPALNGDGTIHLIERSVVYFNGEHRFLLSGRVGLLCPLFRFFRWHRYLPMQDFRYNNSVIFSQAHFLFSRQEP